MKRNINIIISDVGDVLLLWKGVIHTVCTEYGIEEQDFRNYYSSGISHDLYTGKLLGPEFWQSVSSRYQVKILGDPFAEHFTCTVIPDAYACFLHLKAEGVRIVSASNTYLSNWEKSLLIPEMGIYDKHYPSHELHLAKPDPAYYEEICKAEMADANHTLFIDDRDENIEEAQKLGLATYRYRGSDETEGSLEEGLRERFTFSVRKAPKANNLA